MDDQDGLYWSTNLLQAVDTRAQYLDLDQTIQGDQYAMIRDLYLQRKAFQIAEKKVIRQMCLLLMMTNLKMYQKITLIKPKIIKDKSRYCIFLIERQYLDFGHTSSMMDKVILKRTTISSMYFIKPTRSIPFVEQALEALPDLQVIHIDDLDLYDPTIIAIADVQDFLTYKWRLPTIVIAFEHEGSALAQAWEAGALAGWVWNQLPKDLNKALTRIDAQYKRNQDSRDLPSAAELQKRLLPNPIDLLNYEVETFSNLLPIYQATGTTTGSSMIKRFYFISPMYRGMV